MGTNIEILSQSVGRRKEAVARVRLLPGTGEITINGKKLLEYFTEKILQEAIKKPLALLETLKSYDITVKVQGGGRHGQAGAVAHAIARALNKKDETNRTTLKKAGLLTRDSRVKERKKPGRKKARKSPQWSKR